MGQRLLTATGKYGESGRDQKSVFCMGYNAFTDVLAKQVTNYGSR